MAGASGIDDAVGGIQTLDDRSPPREVDSAHFKRMFACACCFMLKDENLTTEHDLASGVLIGPDLVLTNHHVVAAAGGALSRLSCRFYDEGERHAVAGIEFSNEESLTENDRDSVAAANFCRDNGRPYLDYAVLRLAKRVGEEAQGRVEPRDDPFTPLGWVAVDPTPLAVDANIRLVAHLLDSDGKSLRKRTSTHRGALERVADGLRFRHHASTTQGSSGAPAYDIAGRLVAIHNAGWRLSPVNGQARAMNQIIPLERILDDIAKYAPPALHAEILEAARNVPPIASAKQRNLETTAQRAIFALLDRSQEADLCVSGLRASSSRNTYPGFHVIQIFYDTGRSSHKCFGDRLNMLLGDARSFGSVDMTDRDALGRLTGRLSPDICSGEIYTRGDEDPATLANAIRAVAEKFTPGKAFMEVWRFLSGRAYDDEQEKRIIRLFLDALAERGVAPRDAGYPILFHYPAPEAVHRQRPIQPVDGGGWRVEVGLADVSPINVRDQFSRMVEDWFAYETDDDLLRTPPEMERPDPIPMSEIVRLMREPVARVWKRLEKKHFR